MYRLSFCIMVYWLLCFTPQRGGGEGVKKVIQEVAAQSCDPLACTAASCF